MKTKIQTFVRALLIALLLITFILGASNAVEGNLALRSKTKTVEAAGKTVELPNNWKGSVIVVSDTPKLIIKTVDTSQKLPIIQQIRNYSGLGLKESQNVYDAVNAGTPTAISPKSSLTKEEADAAFSAFDNLNVTYEKIGLSSDSLKKIIFSTSFVPSNAIAIGTNGLYYVADSSTGTVIFYAENAKQIKAPTNSMALFSGLKSLTSIDFSNFSTTGVTNMSYMFAGCISLPSIDISTFDMSSVTNDENMFLDCDALTDIKRADLTGKVELPTDWFTQFKNNTPNLPTNDEHKTIKSISFSKNSVPSDAIAMGTDGLYYTFDNTIGSLIFFASDSKVISAPVNSSNLFNGLDAVKSFDFTNFNTSNAIDMSGMFGGLVELVSIDLSNFDTSKVRNMSRMFNFDLSILSLNLSMFDTSSVTDMSGMFSQCETLKNLDISSFNVKNVAYFKYMFNSCKALESVDLSKFDTSNAITFEEMFDNCAALKKLDFSKFDTSKVTTMNQMLNGCYNLKELDLSNFDFSSILADNSYTVGKMYSMLPSGTTSLSVKLSNWDLSKENVRKEVARFIVSNSFNELNLEGCDLSKLSDVMDSDGKITAEKVKITYTGPGTFTISLTNPLYYNGEKYDSIGSTVVSAAAGETITLTSNNDVPSTGVVADMLPVLISLAVLITLAVAGISLKKRRI